jgi:GH43 family beta-xylosidase
MLLLVVVRKRMRGMNKASNIIVEQRADPWVYLHNDGYYYFTGSVPAYDRIELRRATTLDDLHEAEAVDIWHRHEQGIMGGHIWAPEIHYIDGKWYIYFAAGKAEEKFAIRIYVLECEAENPLEGPWHEKGQVVTNLDSFSLDATTFEANGVRYLVWAQGDETVGKGTNLYIAEMSNPWTIKGKQVLIAKPDQPWECIGHYVVEGPAVIQRNNKIFIAYSGSATDHNYAMGLLTADASSNLLDPSSWHKETEPVFRSNEETGQYGPGHNSFTTSTDGKQDILVYHARSYKEIDGEPLYDPNRHARVQPFTWDENGNPQFGVPGITPQV